MAWGRFWLCRGSEAASFSPARQDLTGNIREIVLVPRPRLGIPDQGGGGDGQFHLPAARAPYPSCFASRIMVRSILKGSGAVRA